MEWVKDVIITAIISIEAIALAYLSYKMSKSDKRAAERGRITDVNAKLRKQESALALQMNNANSLLLSALTEKVIRGFVNGELEVAKAAQKAAKDEYDKFLKLAAMGVIGGYIDEN